MKINMGLSSRGLLVFVIATLTVAHVSGDILPNQELLQGRQVFVETCGSCHGEFGQGKIAPSLTKSIKNLSEAEFASIVVNGRGLMPPWKDNQDVMHNMRNMYHYLKRVEKVLVE